MDTPIGKLVKVISGKYKGAEGTLAALGPSEASVLVKRKSWLKFFHFEKYLIMHPDELALA